jgi:UDP-N-acetylglucosamine 2-epimerase (non-hydrolysing)
MKKVLTCVGTRPNLIKITQLDKYFVRYPDIEHKLLHTGQHYDYKMNEVFFEELNIRKPDVFLDINQGSQVEVIARIMIEFEKFILSYKPDLVLVPGDVNSSFACAFVAQRHGIPLAHIESGLRSFDMSMPEEANRLLIDSLADLFFVTEESGCENLLREGKDADKIIFTGNSMIDSLVAFLPAIDASPICEILNAKDYYLLTFHRPLNVDDRANLTVLAELIVELAATKQIIFPAHPRTHKKLEEFGLQKKLNAANILLVEPLGYIDFIHLIKHAGAVITDSGGVQEESTYLGVPCITVRPSTERPVTVTEGTNTLVDLNPTAINDLLHQIESGQYKKGRIPYMWDGKASERIVEGLHQFLTKD